MPPRAARALPLKVGYMVSVVSVRQSGEEYARGRDGRRWAFYDVRDNSVVVEKLDDKHLVIAQTDDNCSLGGKHSSSSSEALQLPLHQLMIDLCWRAEVVKVRVSSYNEDSAGVN